MGTRGKLLGRSVVTACEALAVALQWRPRGHIRSCTLFQAAVDQIIIPVSNHDKLSKLRMAHAPILADCLQGLCYIFVSETAGKDEATAPPMLWCCDSRQLYKYVCAFDWSYNYERLAELKHRCRLFRRSWVSSEHTRDCHQVFAPSPSHLMVPVMISALQWQRCL